jgi:hypothetical protein
LFPDLEPTGIVGQARWRQKVKGCLGEGQSEQKGLNRLCAYGLCV